jgi:hypothetical protein
MIIKRENLPKGYSLIFYNILKTAPPSVTRINIRSGYCGIFNLELLHKRIRPFT